MNGGNFKLELFTFNLLVIYFVFFSLHFCWLLFFSLSFFFYLFISLSLSLSSHLRVQNGGCRLLHTRSYPTRFCRSTNLIYYITHIYQIWINKKAWLDCCHRLAMLPGRITAILAIYRHWEIWSAWGWSILPRDFAILHHNF